MLKRSITGAVVVMLGFSCCVGAAGEIKIHEWAFPPNPLLESNRLDVVLDNGYFIHIVDQDPIRVMQDSSSDDPYHTYSGCKITDVISSFNAELMVGANSVGIAGGEWIADINPSVINPGTTSVSICVKGTNVQVENLSGSKKGVQVGEVVIMVLPE